jgi:hypothetical protein
MVRAAFRLEGIQVFDAGTELIEHSPSDECRPESAVGSRKRKLGGGEVKEVSADALILAGSCPELQVVVWCRGASGGEVDGSIDRRWIVGIVGADAVADAVEAIDVNVRH